MKGALAIVDTVGGTLSSEIGQSGALSQESIASGELTSQKNIDGSLASESEVIGKINEPHTASGELSIPISADSKPYEGAYTFTPTQNAQSIDIKGKTARMDITIEPIPSNYGLITWNGITLTVS